MPHPYGDQCLATRQTVFWCCNVRPDPRLALKYVAVQAFRWQGRSSFPRSDSTRVREQAEMDEDTASGGHERLPFRRVAGEDTVYLREAIVQLIRERTKMDEDTASGRPERLRQ